MARRLLVVYDPSHVTAVADSLSAGHITVADLDRIDYPSLRRIRRELERTSTKPQGD